MAKLFTLDSITNLFMSPPLPISHFIVEGWFNGLYTGLMLVTVWIIVFRTNYSSKHKQGLLIFVILPYICSTMHSSLNWAFYSKAIDDNELPGGPGLLYSLTHIPPWIEGTGDAFFCFNILLADSVFIWRCWTVWNKNWKIVLVPILATLTSAGLAGVVIAGQVIADRNREAIIATKKKQEFIKLSTIYFSLSIGTSLVTTFLISIKILSAQHSFDSGSRQKRKLDRTYRLVIETLVESAAAYSITLLIFVVLLVRKNVNVYYAQNIHAQMAGLAPMMIILRVVSGMSRARDELNSTRVLRSRLAFAEEDLPSASSVTATAQTSSKADW